VSFAGSPDRVEARLVPEAGFELDTFEVAGLPRRPSPALVRSLMLAVGAPFACGRILERRRPHVVLGGGGYVAGPMALAAARRRLPTALLEADAHLGLSNRLAAPVARRVFLSFPIGVLIAGSLIALRLRGRKDYIPFGPAMAAGGFVAYFWGERMLDWYIRYRGGF